MSFVHIKIVSRNRPFRWSGSDEKGTNSHSALSKGRLIEYWEVFVPLMLKIAPT